MFFSVLFLSLVGYVPKEYDFILHSRLIPYSYSLSLFSWTLYFLFPIPRIHSNGIVLTQSFCLLRQFDSRSKCMRTCHYCNIDTVLCHCYIRQGSTIPTVRPQPSLISICSSSVPPASRCSVRLYLDTDDAMQRYRASKNDVQNRRVKVSALSSRLLVLLLQYPRAISSEHRASQLLWIAASSKHFLFTCTPSRLQRNPLRFLFLSSLHHFVCYPS